MTSNAPGPAYRDNGGPLDVLHPWHPWDDDHTEATPFFTRLINECGVFATVFAVEERERAKYADAGAAPVRRFMQPLPPIDASPAALPPPPIPMVPSAGRIPADVAAREAQERATFEPVPPAYPHPLPPLPVVPYEELAETTLTHDWFTGPGVAIPADDEEPRSHRRRGPGGRFISREATGGT
jgi:hypothetical protein